MKPDEWKGFFLLLRDIFKIYKNYRKVFVSMIVLAVLSAVSPFVAVVLTGVLVDAVYAGRSLSSLFTIALGGLGVTFVCSAAGARMTQVFNQHLEYMLEIQNRPMNGKALDMDYAYLEDAAIHDMRQNGAAPYMRFGLVGVFLSDVNKLLTYVLSILISLGIIMPMFLKGNRAAHGQAGAWYVSALFLFLLLFLTWLGYKSGAHFNRKIGRVRKALAPEENKRRYYMTVLADSESQKDLRVYGQQELYLRETEEIVERVRKVWRTESGYQSVSEGVGRTISSLMGFLVYAFAGWRAWAGIISIGSVVTCAASILRLTDAIVELIRQVGYMKGKVGNCRDYRTYMGLENQKHQGTLPLEKRRDDKFSVEFEHVSFRYPGSDQYVIKDLNLKFVVGEKMAIVGKNGSGKTTFIKLLCRLYDVTEGCIKVNGIDIRKYDYKEYCNLFAIVFQDFRMFAFSLGENVASSGHVEQDRAVDALGRAGLKERFGDLPEGLNTYVGKEYDEDGVNFSGGEKQKMAIARAIYKNAPFVIMDEPTAALDPEAECGVFAGFDRMVGKKTAIYISHRLASCRFCEDILVFDHGEVVQRGSHEELAGEPGVYRELWEAQAQYYVPAGESIAGAGGLAHPI
ncbi:MAG: ABC transporter ATP-binding protein [Lachnospiraceae bacterium]|nr:ABC transporter ATP-binding protein [Lachnospiraceae bacterium]